MQFDQVYHKREPDLADALAYNTHTHPGAGPYLPSNSAANSASFHHHQDATNTIDPYAHTHHHPHASSNTHHSSSLPIQYPGSDSYPDYSGISSKAAPLAEFEYAPSYYQSGSSNSSAYGSAEGYDGYGGSGAYEHASSVQDVQDSTTQAQWGYPSPVSTTGNGMNDRDMFASVSSSSPSSFLANAISYPSSHDNNNTQASYTHSHQPYTRSDVQPQPIPVTPTPTAFSTYDSYSQHSQSQSPPDTTGIPIPIHTGNAHAWNQPTPPLSSDSLSTSSGSSPSSSHGHPLAQDDMVPHPKSWTPGYDVGVGSGYMMSGLDMGGLEGNAMDVGGMGGRGSNGGSPTSIAPMDLMPFSNSGYTTSIPSVTGPGPYVQPPTVPAPTQVSIPRASVVARQNTQPPQQQPHYQHQHHQHQQESQVGPKRTSHKDKSNKKSTASNGPYPQDKDKDNKERRDSGSSAPSSSPTSGSPLTSSPMSSRAVHAHASTHNVNNNVMPTSTSLTKVAGSGSTTTNAMSPHVHPYVPVTVVASATSSAAAAQSVKNGNGAGDVSTGAGQGQQVSMKRPPGACSRCKRLKMRCVFNDDASVCQRCTAGGHECVSEGRKARTPSEREFLLRQIRSKNEQVTNVLRQLHTLPGSYTPLGIVPSHLTLSAQEREQFTEVLTYLEKRSTKPLPAPDGTTKAVQPFDSRPLEEDGEVYSDSEDEEMDVERHLLGRHSQDHSGDENSDSEDCSRTRGAGRSGKGKGKELARPRTPKLHALPDRTAPVGFLADASLKYGARGFSPEDFLKGMGAAGRMGIANGLYFRPGPYADLDLRRIIIEREQVPEILSSGLISFDDAKALFRIYFERINTFLSGIDETIYTPASVLRRCPFLFTVICAVSSRYFFERPGLYKIAMHFAKAAAASTVVDGWKTVETCQAYLILAAYGFPTRRFEEDRGWCYTAIATRMAVELNLNKPPPPNSTPAKPEDERHEREMLNNRRTWMLCCIMDYSTAMQLGKPPTILEDELIRNAEHWCSSSTFQHPYDVHLPVIISFLRIMNGFIEAVSNIPLHLQRDEAHVTAKIKEFYDRVDLLVKVSLKRGMRGQDERDDMAMILREGMIAYLGHYCRLIILSYGYQADLGGSASVSQATFLAGCIDACFQLVDVWTNQMLPTGNMKYSPEFFYIGAGFTGAFLLRLLHPSLAETIDQNKRVKIYNVAQRLISSLASPVVAIDEEHTPKQYATFLEELMRNMVALWEQQGGVGASASASSASGGGRKNKSKSGMREARVQEVTAC